MVDSSCCSRRHHTASTFRTRHTHAAPQPAPSLSQPPLVPLEPGGRLRLRAFAEFAARGMGPVCDRGRWQYDVRHGPPNGRLPLSFSARAAAPPPALGGSSSLVPIPPPGVDCDASLRLDSFSPRARPVLAFCEMSISPVLPDEYEPAIGAERSAALFWRLFATDSCEAVHAGVLLAIRRLIGAHASSLVPCDARGVPIAELGMHTAERIRPFDRHVKISPSRVRLSAGAAGGRRRLAIDGAPPPPPSHGGAMHQLVWLRAADGKESVCDFTGPQYGIEERLEGTRTPFWECDLSDGGAALRAGYGLELRGQPLSYSATAQLPAEALQNEMHAHIGLWIRDSILGVLVHAGALRCV